MNILKIYKRSDILVTVTNVTIIPRVGELVDISNTTFEVKNIVWRMSNEGILIKIQVV